MASQEHLQQLMNDETDDSSSNSSASNIAGGDTESAIAEPVTTTAITPKFKLPAPNHPPAKKRVKISLKPSTTPVKNDDLEDEVEFPDAKPSLSMAASFPKVPARRRSQSPTQRQRLNKRSLPTKQKASPPKKEVSEREIEATIVDSDDGGDDDAVATAIADEPTPTLVASSERNQQKKKSNLPNYRSFRLPPFSSPGLLVPISHAVTMIKGKPAGDDPSNSASSGGLTTMGSVFDQYLTKLGYTEETRTKIPHIGSSVKRHVGDMFDSNVKFTTRFPKLIPEDLIPSASNDMDDNEESRFSLAERLISVLEVEPSEPETISNETIQESKAAAKDNHSEAPRKRQKLKSWKDMAPLSLTLPYPESFVRKQLEYVDEVNKRESAILAYKKEVETLERENPELLEENSNANQETKKKPATVVPPIPRPPSPPHLSDLATVETREFNDTAHPIYLPKSKELLAHLDKDCFHISEGRYFGLSSNVIADPHFVGPVAPGLNGLNLTASNGLATAPAGGLNMGSLPSQSSLPNTSVNKSGSGKKSASHSQAVSIPSTTSKKKKKKPAIALPLRPMSLIKNAAATTTQ
ncbi:unnamed protein product [Cylindrotheca closterium]|uniref:Uncharacterized protein n=1 Tax=Cylindrotheca closterium TaxID=2856 RepID=A0AAD2CVW6_9STRA|nr:unnamed protein product [Cylindrotheca closterium]